MDLREIDHQVFVSGQLDENDIDDLAKQGFRTIICNRPDHESPDQPDFDRIAAKARAKGMLIYYLPIIPQELTAQSVEDMKDLLEDAQYPLLAYCRSGVRSERIYRLATGKA